MKAKPAQIVSEDDPPVISEAELAEIERAMGDAGFASDDELDAGERVISGDEVAAIESQLQRSTANAAIEWGASAGRAISDAEVAAVERVISNADLERLATGPLDTLTTRRLTPEDVANAARVADEPANENAPPPSMSTARLATIAPRGVFLPDRVVVDVEGDTFPSTKLDEQGRDESILPNAILEQIKHHAAEGQRLVGDEPAAAFLAFRSALDLLPAPVENWNAAGWLLVAMGEAAVQSGDYARAFQPLKDAMHCPGTIGNPWVHLRLGQCRFELADERASDELARAYIGGGRTMFDGLDDKYFALVEKVLQPPPGHDRLP